MADPRNNPEFRDPTGDPAHPDYVNPANRGLNDPVAPRAAIRAERPRGIGGAAVAAVLVLLAVLAFAMFGGTSTDEAGVAPSGEPAIEGTENPPTSSIQPAPAEPAAPAPAPEANDAAPVEPATPAPAE